MGLHLTRCFAEEASYSTQLLQTNSSYQCSEHPGTSITCSTWKSNWMRASLQLLCQYWTTTLPALPHDSTLLIRSFCTAFREVLSSFRLRTILDFHWLGVWFTLDGILSTVFNDLVARNTVLHVNSISCEHWHTKQTAALG